MKAWDYRAVYFNGDCFCVDCLPTIPTEVYEKEVIPIFAVEEADYYPVCCVCGTEHDYIGLTDDGRKLRGN
jgi:hypothetical protein